MIDDRIYKFIKLMVILLSLFPRTTLKFFSDGMGLVWYKIDKRHRKVALENINFAYPGRFSSRQAERFVKENFKNTASILFEVIWSYRRTRDELFKYVEIKGLKYFETAQKKGRGVILLTGHIGNFELGGAALALVVETPYGVYRKFDFHPLERFLLEERQRFGTRMIALSGASKKIDVILRNGGVVGTLLDQNSGWYNGVPTFFFGRPACTNKGLAKLALRTKSPVIPLFIMKKNEQYIMEFLPEVPLQVTDDPIKDIENNTQNYVAVIESMVRQCPEQYFWVHRRWKTKPYSKIQYRKIDE